MEETVLYPSPSWFLPSILAVSKDGWLVYGGPGKTLVVLEPLSPDLEGVLDRKQSHKTHVVNKSHNERIVSVDISPEWPEKRHFVTAGSDGAVKQWSITQEDKNWNIKSIHSHESHVNEEMVGVGYSMSSHVLSIGSFCNIVEWELNTNMTNKHYNLMRSFRATCISCSPHIPLVAAVGTKQGVVFVIDLNGIPNVVYKVRGQDDEIGQVVWCPQYEVILKRSLDENTIKKSTATKRLEAIRNEPEPSDLNASGEEKNLPEDSFDEPVVQEDDTFDIYQDYEADEFGHKKYQPEEIVVKKKDNTKKDDFLAECERLKAQILKNKQEEEESIESLVEAMDKAQVEEPTDKKLEDSKTISGSASLVASGSKLVSNEGSDHIHKHLLASISKNGYSLRIWSKTGKLVASCAVVMNTKTSYGKVPVNRMPQHANMCWYKPDSLLIVDGKVSLLECNPLQVDNRNRLRWTVLQSAHRRGVYHVASAGPRVQTDPHCDDDWPVYTVAQDRFLIMYDMKEKKVVEKYGTCGGFVYDVRACQYDAGKLSLGIGDGAIRIWETHTTGEDDNKLSHGEITAYWQNVQGKILQCVWHPTKENILAFATAESRVGIIDTTRMERPARVLPTAVTHGIYSISWGEKMNLFAVGGKEMVMYQANRYEDAPIPIHIEIEGQKWEPAVVNYSSRGLCIGSMTGGVCVFSGPGGRALAAKFVFKKFIHSIQWHPLQTSNSDEESPYKNLLAITSADKISTIVILNYEDREGGGKQFTNFTTLEGHSDMVLQVCWSPHRDGQLLSTCPDGTARVWDVANSVCLAIFGGHSGGTVSGAWCAQPQLADYVLTGGTDFSLRLWDMRRHLPQDYTGPTKEEKRRRKKKSKRSEANAENDEKTELEDETSKTEDNVPEINDEEDVKTVEAASEITNIRESKVPKRFLLPILSRQMTHLTVDGPIKVLDYIVKNKEIKNILDLCKEEDAAIYGLDVFRIFGTINELNEVLDEDCAAHIELKAYKEYLVLMIFRGQIDAAVQFANERDILDPMLLSIVPCVSVKYWKDTMQMYIAQIDRMVAKKHHQDDPLGNWDCVSPVFRKALSLLSLHDVKGAVEVLTKGKLHKEAYILCRCRHMDSIAKEVLSKWAIHTAYVGNLSLSAFLYLVKGEISYAASVLRRSTQPEFINLAAELAKSAGLNTFADFLETIVKSSEKEPILEDETEEPLAELPTKADLFVKENKIQNGEASIEKLVDKELEELPIKMESLMKENKVQNGEAKNENGAVIVTQNSNKETE